MVVCFFNYLLEGLIELKIQVVFALFSMVLHLGLPKFNYGLFLTTNALARSFLLLCGAVK